MLRDRQCLNLYDEQPEIFHCFWLGVRWLFRLHYLNLPCWVISWRCMLGGSIVVWRFEVRRSIFLIRSVHGGSNSFWHAKRFSNEFGPQRASQNRSLFMQIQTLPISSMHHKWREIIDIVCRITNGKVPFSWLFCIHYPSIWRCILVWSFELRRMFDVGWLKVKLILVCQKVLQ